MTDVAYRQASDAEAVEPRPVIELTADCRGLPPAKPAPLVPGKEQLLSCPTGLAAQAAPVHIRLGSDSELAPQNSWVIGSGFCAESPPGGPASGSR